MDAWEILRANSDAPEGSDLWTLINTQKPENYISLSLNNIKTVLLETDEGLDLIDYKYPVILKDIETPNLSSLINPNPIELIETIIERELILESDAISITDTDEEVIISSDITKITIKD